MTSRFLPWALSVVLSITLAGCGTLERPYASSRSTPLEVAYHEEVRTRSSDPETMASFSAEMTALLQAERPLTVLALSGGGANGAYGAGVLVGWSRRGDRPTFDVVTGVSTGALAAPFAFLGPDWDDELSDAYTSGKTSGLVGLDNLAALFQPSLFSAAPLRRLVDTNVTPELLQAIATEHAKGRRLLVATTNLDQEETVIWDMGQLATQGDEPSHNLFKEILVASASIPGVFPPVLIAARERGQAVHQMHVDGGVNLPFIAIPEDLLLWTRSGGGGVGGDIYVLVNGKMGRREGVTAGDVGGILARTYDSSSKSSLRQTLMLTATFAERNGLGMAVTSIPDEAPASSLNFDRDSMIGIFNLGRERAERGEAWNATVDHRRRPEPVDVGTLDGGSWPAL